MAFRPAPAAAVPTPLPLLVVPLLLLIAPAPAVGQEGTVDPDEGPDRLGPFDEEISVDLVNLQVWVTDAQGDPVPGLTRADFELYEDGERVEITNFSAYGAVAADAAAAEDPPLRGLVPSLELEVSDEPVELEAVEVPVRQPLHLSVLVDNWNIRPADRARVFRYLREFLEQNLEEGDRVAIAVHDRSLRLVQPFTRRLEEVDGTLDRIQDVASQAHQMRTEESVALQVIQETMVEAERIAVKMNMSACGLAFGHMQATARNYAATMQGHVQSSAGAIATLARILAGTPGRRVVVYVGNGLAMTPGAMLFEYVSDICPHYRQALAMFHLEYDMSWLYEEVAARANAAAVTLHTIEARSGAIDLGLDRPGGSAKGSGISSPHRPESGGGNLTQLNRADRSASARARLGSGRRYTPATHLWRMKEQDEEHSLVLMARQTGGRAVLNGGDLTRDFERIATDLRSYYSLGFRPSDPEAGRIHRLKVELVDGDGHRVRHRLAYRSRSPEERMVERVRGVAQLGVGANPLGVRVESGDAVPGELAYRVPVRIWVPLVNLEMEPGEEDGSLEGRLRILMTTTDTRGELMPVRQKVVPVVAGREEVPDREQLVQVELELGPGKHTVAFAVQDLMGSKTSYLRTELPVP